MNTYQYKARDKFGKLIEGRMGSDSEDAVAAKLEKMGYIPVVIIKAKEESKIAVFLGGLKKISFADLNLFTRQLYTLQKAGLPLIASLNSLRDQAANKKLKNVITQIIRDVESGATLSEAMERHPGVFNHLYISMIRSGEVSGRLPEILDRLAVLGEHEEEIRMRIKTAMRYPFIVVGAIIVGFTVLITFVVPKFFNLYSKFDAELPFPTKVLININYLITEFWWVLILLFIAIVFLCRKLISTKEGRVWFDAFRLKVPVFGPLMFKLIMSRFARITGLMMMSGVPILQILELVSEGIGNVVISNTISKIKDSVKEGKGMSEPMKESGQFDPIVVQMVSVGENAGKVDELLLHVSDYYDRQIDHTIKNLVSLIEPILIFVLGIAVLFMALGIFLPMWNLMDLFKR